MVIVLQGFDNGDLTLIHFLPLELGSFGTCSQNLPFRAVYPGHLSASTTGSGPWEILPQR